VIVVGLILAGILLVTLAAQGLDDGPPQESRFVDALLFLLCLVSVLHAKQLKEEGDD
jgi:hypothetical protein